jgi:hypothetical protein
MSKTVFGEVDWNEGDVGGGGGNRASDFMKLKEGKSRVRVLGNPVQFYVHWIETPDGQKRKINSPISDPKLVKQLVDNGFKRQARWIVKVLDRSDGGVKLLEVSSQIFNGIKTLVQDEEWGPVTSYDVIIKRGSPGQQPLYQVTPCPKSPLDVEAKSALQAFNDRVDLTKLTQPAEPEKVREELGWSTPTPAAKSKPVAASDDDDDNYFEFDTGSDD